MPRYAKETVEQFFDYNLFVPTRTLYIGNDDETEVNFEMARNAIKSLHVLDSISSEPITVLLNTFGGCWYNGMGIYDAVQNSRSHVDAYVIGSAMSMGSIILQAADKRWIYPNATLMVHDGSEELHGTPRTVLNWARSIEDVLNTMYKIYAERSGKTVAFWRKKCANDFILTAKEAKAYGLVDSIVGETDGM